MTTADKTNIENLLKEASSMKKVSEDMNREYHDAKIAEYCKKAYEEYCEIHDYIVEQVVENIELFFNLDCLKIWHFSGIVGGNGTIRAGSLEVEHFGEFFDIRFSLVPGRCHCVRYNDGYYEIECASGGVIVNGVDIHTSKTELREYRICSGDTLDRCKNFPIAIEGNYNSASWNVWYNRANLTREKSKLLLSSFGDTVRQLAKSFHAKANQGEQFFKKNDSVGEYVSVRSV